LPESRPFFTRVESLRGLGALAVAGYHFSGWWVHGVALLPDYPWSNAGPFQNAARWLAWHLMPGRSALMMFFVISGFVLRVSLQYGPQKPASAAFRFIVSRMFRIYPIVIFGTLVFALVNNWQIPASPDHPARPFESLALIKHFLLLDVSLNTTLWALQVEVLMAPIIVSLYFVERRYGIRPILAFAIVTTALSFSKQWALWPPLSHCLFAFVVGILIPTLGRDLVTRLSPTLASRTLAGAALLMFLPTPLFGFYSQFSAVIETYAAAVLLGLIAYRTDLRGCYWLDSWPVRQLGLSSGSYYVLHMVTFPTAVTIASALIPMAWSQAAPIVVGVLVLTIWLAAIAPLAMASYYMIEAPGIALGRRCVNGLKPMRAALPNS
jgi:peptidoglycan/LPS O-acetylase OafA/YrhL